MERYEYNNKAALVHRHTEQANGNNKGMRKCGKVAENNLKQVFLLASYWLDCILLSFSFFYELECKRVVAALFFCFNSSPCERKNNNNENQCEGVGRRSQRTRQQNRKF
jgi:hypothetical protein